MTSHIGLSADSAFNDCPAPALGQVRCFICCGSRAQKLTGKFMVQIAPRRSVTGGAAEWKRSLEPIIYWFHPQASTLLLILSLRWCVCAKVCRPAGRWSVDKTIIKSRCSAAYIIIGSRRVPPPKTRAYIRKYRSRSSKSAAWPGWPTLNTLRILSSLCAFVHFLDAWAGVPSSLVIETSLKVLRCETRSWLSLRIIVWHLHKRVFMNGAHATYISKRDHFYIKRRNRAEWKPLRAEFLAFGDARHVIAFYFPCTRAAFRALTGAVNILLSADVSAVVKFLSRWVICALNRYVFKKGQHTFTVIVIMFCVGCFLIKS